MPPTKGCVENNCRDGPKTQTGIETNTGVGLTPISTGRDGPKTQTGIET